MLDLNLGRKEISSGCFDESSTHIFWFDYTLRRSMRYIIGDWDFHVKNGIYVPVEERHNLGFLTNLYFSIDDIQDLFEQDVSVYFSRNGERKKVEMGRPCDFRLEGYRFDNPFASKEELFEVARRNGLELGVIDKDVSRVRKSAAQAGLLFARTSATRH